MSVLTKSTNPQDVRPMTKTFAMKSRPWLLPAAKIAAVVALASVIRIALNPALGSKVPFVTLFPAIVYGAWVLGWRGGLLATFLSALSGLFLILRPNTSPDSELFSDQFSLIMFLFAGLTVAALGQAQQKAQDQGLRREEELHARAEREALLNRVGLAIRSSLDPGVIQQTAVAVLGEALEVDRCYFATYDAARIFIDVSSDWARPDLEAIIGQYREEDCGAALHEVFTARTTCVANDTHAQGFSEATLATLDQKRLRALIAVPLYDEGRLTAALIAGMADGPRAWTAEEARLAEAVAEQTRTALATAMIAQREHAIATQLQEALQPSLPNAAPGLSLAEHYKPALSEAEIGGDFYDVFALQDNCTALVVADLSGKGLAAAAQVATVRNMLRYALYNDGSLAQSVATLNHTLAQHNLLAGFATLFTAYYDSTSRRLCYVNCGQEPALLWRAATQEVQELPSTGPVLGMASSSGFSEVTQSLQSGDTLVVFTDGLTEAGPRRLQLLGVAGVAALLQETMRSTLPLPAPEKAAAIVSRLIAGVDSFAQGGARDDVCLLVAIVE